MFWVFKIFSQTKTDKNNYQTTIRQLSINVIPPTEAVARRCSVKKVFLESSQNSQENTCARVSFLIKLQASGLQLY